jgi:adenylate cyclase, class 2
MSLVEAELKCRLTTEVQYKLYERLQAMQLKGTVHNLDSYYDTASWDLLRRAVFVRIRNQQRLEFKFNEQAEQSHVQCTERTFPLETDDEKWEQMNELFATFLPDWHNAPDVASAIASNDLIELACIDNRRTIYTYGTLEVCIDAVAGLGDFLELEVRCPQGPAADEALATLQALAADLKAAHIPVGYVELWLREHNPAAYQVGKYRLEP